MCICILYLCMYVYKLIIYLFSYCVYTSMYLNPCLAACESLETAASNALAIYYIANAYLFRGSYLRGNMIGQVIRNQ